MSKSSLVNLYRQQSISSYEILSFSKSLKPIPKKFSQMLQLFENPWVVSLFAGLFGDPEIAAIEPEKSLRIFGIWATACRF